MANERTAAALKAKGYHYRYVFGENAGHCDGNVSERHAGRHAGLDVARLPDQLTRGCPRLSPRPRPRHRRAVLLAADRISRRWLKLIGFVMWTSKPAAAARVRSSGCPYPVSATRKMSRAAGRANATRHLVAVEARKADVHQRDLGVSGDGALHTLLAVHGGVDPVSFRLEQLLERFAVVVAVLDDEDVARRRRCLHRGRMRLGDQRHRVEHARKANRELGAAAGAGARRRRLRRRAAGPARVPR